MNNFVISTSFRGVLIENLEACMQQRVATSPTTIGALSNMDLSMVEEFATALLKWRYKILLPKVT